MIRAKLMLVALAFLSLPLLGYQYVRELNIFLLQGQEQALQLTARAVATVLHGRPELFSQQTGVPHRLHNAWDLYAHPLRESIKLDGFFDDWGSLPQDASKHTQNHLLSSSVEKYKSEDISFQHLLGFDTEYLYALFVVTDDNLVLRNQKILRLDNSDHLRIYLRDEFNNLRYYLLTAEKSGRLSAYEVDKGWKKAVSGKDESDFYAYIQPVKDDEGGYTIELRLPLHMLGGNRRIAFAIADVDDTSQREVKSVMSTINPEMIAQLNRVLVRSPEIERILQGLDRPNARIWVVDQFQRVRALTGALQARVLPEPSSEDVSDGLLSPIYNLILPPPNSQISDLSSDTIRLEGEAIEAALSGISITNRRQSLDKRAEIVMSTHPIWSDKNGEKVVQGAVVVEQSANEIIALQNRSLENIISTTLVVFILTLIILLWFATSLTFRIRRLKSEAEAAIDIDGRVQKTAICDQESGRDEIGDLSRSISTMLARLSQYTNYLEKMPSTLKHEILNPLNAVHISLENLEGEIYETKTTAKYIRSAKNGIKRLGSILTSLTEASSLEEALSFSEQEYFDLHRLLVEYLENYISLHSENTFSIELQDSRAKIYGDQEAIVQMLDKLLDNACDFSAANQPIIIRTNLLDGNVILQIINRGQLLPEDIKEQLFESMVSSRSSSGTNTKPHLGLGLYVARTIVAHHNGAIYAENMNDGNGVVISVEFPLATLRDLAE